MAVRLVSNNGSSDWNDGNVLYGADLRDTFHSVVNPPLGAIIAWAKDFNSLISEDFEGTGAPAGWTTNAGSPDYDYTTQARGVQSVQIAAADESVTKTFAAQSGDFYVSFWFRPLATDYTTKLTHIGLRTYGSDTGNATITLSGTQIYYRGTSTNNSFTTPITISAQWYRAVIIAHKASNTVDYYVFDNDGVSLLGSALSIAVSSLVNDRFNIGTDSTTGVAVDDVFVYGGTAVISQDLGDKWVECNGQTLSDSESPFNGATIPDLNAQAGTARFLRGAITSGGTGGAETHNHGGTTGITGGTSEVNGGSTCNGTNTGVDCAGGATHVRTQSIASDSSLPSYYAIIWIMRVK